MDRKPPWGMVFSVVAVIVAAGVAGYAVKKAMDRSAGPGFAPALGSVRLEIRWLRVSGQTTYGEAFNLTDSPVNIASMSIPAERKDFKDGFYRGTREVAILANWETEINKHEPEEVVKFLSGGMVDATIQPGSYARFHIPIAMRQLPSGMVIKQEDGGTVTYRESLPR